MSYHSPIEIDNNDKGVVICRHLNSHMNTLLRVLGHSFTCTDISLQNRSRSKPTIYEYQLESVFPRSRQKKKIKIPFVQSKNSLSHYENALLSHLSHTHICCLSAPESHSPLQYMTSRRSSRLRHIKMKQAFEASSPREPSLFKRARTKTTFL